MTGLVFVATLVLLPLLGWGLVPRRAAAWLPIPAGAAVAAGLGALAVTGEMLAMSAAGIRWTTLRIVAVPLCLTVLRVAVHREAGKRWPRVAAVSAIGVAMGTLLTVYSSLSTRATSSDLLLFWGAKAERFAAARAIDVAFLTNPFHWGLHSDYPPLLPCIWAFASLTAGRFAWGGSLATLPVFATFLVIAVWGLSRLDGDEGSAARSAAIVAALLAATLPVAGTAGNADPVLLFFEGTALCLVLFATERPGSPAIVGMFLAAGVLTKFEGTFFAVGLVAASLLVPRRTRVRDTAIIGILPALALLSWFVFCRSQGLFTYLKRPPRLYLGAERLAIVGRGFVAGASYGAAYVPWIVVFLLLCFTRASRARFTVALGTAGVTLAADGLIYLISPDDPTLWVAWSASRLLLTPLFCLYAAAISAPGGAAVRWRSSGDRTRSAASAAPAA